MCCIFFCKLQGLNLDFKPNFRTDFARKITKLTIKLVKRARVITIYKSCGQNQQKQKKELFPIMCEKIVVFMVFAPNKTYKTKQFSVE